MDSFKFIPLLQPRIWGGHRLQTLKHGPHTISPIGESWEISGLPEHETLVSGGPCKGWTLNRLLTTWQDKLVGKENYKRFPNVFPLLIKIIDTEADLSIQVHPDDNMAHAHNEPYGKTEMWYVVNARPDARLLAGFKTKMTAAAYDDAICENSFINNLNTFPVCDGDCFFIPARQAHALGAGMMVVEIQQTSDTTFRIYDYGRKDKNGRTRALHTEEAKKTLDFQPKNDFKITYPSKLNQRINMVSSPFFTTSVYALTERRTLDYSALDSFVILIVTEGQCHITDKAESVSLQTGETLLLAASTSQVTVVPDTESCKFLEIFIEP